MFNVFVKSLSADVTQSAKALQSIYGDEIFAWAIAAAVKDFSFTTRGEWNGEEHRTSAMMGFLGTSMGVFGLLGALSGIETEGRVLWHASNKRSSRHGGRGEAETGVDFGVAMPAPSEGNVRISCFQAKNVEKDGGADLRRPPKVEPSAEGRMAAACADFRLAKWASSAPPPEHEFDATEPNHQMFKMVMLQQAGIKWARIPSDCKGESWVHYVLWRPNGPPIQFSLDSLLESHQKLTTKSIPLILDKLCKRKLLSTPHLPFGDHLLNGLTDTHPGWIELPIGEATKLLGHFVELGGDWYVVDYSDRLAYELTKDLVSRQVLAPPVTVSSASEALLAWKSSPRPQGPRPGGGSPP